MFITPSSPLNLCTDGGRYSENRCDRVSDGRAHARAAYGTCEQVTLREIGVLRQALYVGEGGHELPLLLQRMAAPQTRIVTLTVTEKGYCLHPATGQLRIEDPTIVLDIAQIPRCSAVLRMANTNDA